MRKTSSTISLKQGSIRHHTMEQKRERLIFAADSLFRKNGIKSTSMEQISKEAGVGSATIYRYLPTKPQLVCSVASLQWLLLKQRYLPILQSDAYISQTEAEQLRTILLLFLTLYEEHTDFLSFLADFDTYIKSTALPKEQLSGYEDIISSLKNMLKPLLQ